MTENQLQHLKTQWTAYVNSFANEQAQLTSILQLKADHCERVAGEARSLSQALRWTVPAQVSAEALGLLHDIGRFSQYTEYETFADMQSVDHGERGADVVASSGWLFEMSPLDAQAVLCGIQYHNRQHIPENVTAENLPFVKLIRDADKLDIFNVVLQAVEKDGFRELPDMLPYVSLQRSVSPEILEEIRRQHSCSLNRVKTLGDFLLLQMSWVYDMNYSMTLQYFDDRGILSRILQNLSSSPGVYALEEEISEFLSEQLSEDSLEDCRGASRDDLMLGHNCLVDNNNL